MASSSCLPFPLTANGSHHQTQTVQKLQQHQQHQQQRRRRPRTATDSSSYSYTLDVLTDGSESTGDGSLFLSVWKGKNPLSNDDTSSVLLARYAITGVGDLTSRLAADQRFKLNVVRALFCVDDIKQNHHPFPTNLSQTKNNHEHTTAKKTKTNLSQGLWGLVSLFMALAQAGSASLSIVLPSLAQCESVERIMDSILGARRQYPQLQLCHVPDNNHNHNKDDKDDSVDQQWWKVYLDEYVLVHASRCNYGAATIQYVFTLLQHSIDPVYSLLLTRCGNSWNSQQQMMSTIPTTLPLVDTTTTDDDDDDGGGGGDNDQQQQQQQPQQPARLYLGIALVSVQDRIKAETPMSDTVDSSTAAAVHSPNSIPWYLIRPSCYWRHTIDPGLLVRSQQQSMAWHQHNPRQFPWNLPVKQQQQQQQQQYCDDDCQHSRSNEGSQRLLTGWSLVLNAQLALLDRLAHLKKQTVDPERASWPNHYFPHSSSSGQLQAAAASLRDDNEIDLDTDSDDESEEPALEHADDAGEQHPVIGTGTITEKESSRDFTHEINDCSTTATASDPAVPNACTLLFLGTGCAAPSPYRGASGYALQFASGDCFVFEAGEGFVTQWNRYASSTTHPLECIRVIWISHAHWDHYGGLVPLLTTIFDSAIALEDAPRSEAGKHATTNHAHKRARLQKREAPLVIAPNKVLEYLKLSFAVETDYFRGISLQSTGSLSEEIMQRCLNCQFQTIEKFQVVPVDHGCAAYGFILAIRNHHHQQQQQCISQSQPFLLCFSGDTRPCRRFVLECNRARKQFAKASIDLLIHEATFHESELEMCLAKKHSTITEALQVAHDISARHTFLTHFSQRYDSPPQKNEHMAFSGSWTPAFDGLQIQLMNLP